MKPRLTLGQEPNKNPVRRNSISPDQRYSIHNSNLTSNMKMGATYNIEELTNSINKSLECVISLNNDGRSMSKHNVIKNDKKTVESLFASFLNAFEPGFDSSKVEIQNLPEIFRLLKYSGVVSKNLFNPIGAQHTWGQLLTIIKWLGQLASYYSANIDNIKHYISIDWDIENIIFQGFTNGNLETTKLQQYFEQKISQIKSKNLDSIYREQNIKMALDNLQKSQKDLVWAEEEVRKIGQLEFREINLITNTEQQLKELQRNINQNRSIAHQVQSSIDQARLQLRRINQIVDKQTMSVEEVRKMQDEIAELQIKKAQFEVDFRKNTESYQSQINHIITNFSKQKAKLDARADVLKVQSQNSKQFGNFSDLSVDIGVFKEYMLGPALSSSHLINRMYLWNQQEEVFKLRKIQSNINNESKQLKEKLQNIHLQISQHEIANNQNFSTLIQIKSRIEIIKKSIQEMKQHCNIILSQIHRANTERIALKQSIGEKEKKFNDVTQSTQQLCNLNQKLAKKKEEHQEKWQSYYNNMILNTKMVIEKADQLLRKQHLSHKQFNKKHKGDIIKTLDEA